MRVWFSQAITAHDAGEVRVADLGVPVLAALAGERQRHRVAGDGRSGAIARQCPERDGRAGGASRPGRPERHRSAGEPRATVRYLAHNPTEQMTLSMPVSSSRLRKVTPIAVLSDSQRVRISSAPSSNE